MDHSPYKDKILDKLRSFDLMVRQYKVVWCLYKSMNSEKPTYYLNTAIDESV